MKITGVACPPKIWTAMEIATQSYKLFTRRNILFVALRKFQNSKYALQKGIIWLKT